MRRLTTKNVTSHWTCWWVRKSLVRNLTTTTLEPPQVAARRGATSSRGEFEWRAKSGSSLYKRLSALGGSGGNAGDVLDHWVGQGRSFKKYEIIGHVCELRKYKKYTHAIQILEWLENRGLEFSPGDHGIYLDLLWKIEGIDSAEKYFESLPEKARNRHTYGALLHCYCKGKIPEKAIMLLEKMKELDYISTTLVYNDLMSLLISVGEPEKVPPLIEEMKNKRITPDLYTYNLLMNSYASLKDIESAEKVLEEMQEAGVKCEWVTYTNLASIYVKEGLMDKANLVLKEVEHIQGTRDIKAYHILISLYARISNRDGVYRVWKSLQLFSPRTTNMSYLTMLQGLSRLGDIHELETCFAEWESSCFSYDIRVANVVIDFYLGRDMIEKAEKLCEESIRKGGVPDIRTLEMFMMFYLKVRRIDMALKYFKEASLIARETAWKPSEESVCMFLKYFEEEKDVNGAENYYKILKGMDSVNTNIYDSLIRIFSAAGLKETQKHQWYERMDCDECVA